MKMLRRALAGAALLGASAGALAHAGHGTEGLVAGLAHPLGIDHLLAMVAVGAWSALALPAGRRAAGPLVFMLALLAGALAGRVIGGGTLIEAGIAASVIGFGVLLLAPRALPAAAGLALLAFAALLHGVAHGAEVAAGEPFAPYAAGLLATTALLHALGLAAGRTFADARLWVWQFAAAALGATGLLLLVTV